MVIHVIQTDLETASHAKLQSSTPKAKIWNLFYWKACLFSEVGRYHEGFFSTKRQLWLTQTCLSKMLMMRSQTMMHRGRKQLAWYSFGVFFFLFKWDIWIIHPSDHNFKPESTQSWIWATRQLDCQSSLWGPKTTETTFRTWPSKGSHWNKYFQFLFFQSKYFHWRKTSVWQTYKWFHTRFSKWMCAFF